MASDCTASANVLLVIGSILSLDLAAVIPPYQGSDSAL
jgi:hypothetical protein